MSTTGAAPTLTSLYKLVYSRREFANALGLSLGMVDKMLRAGQIKARRAGDRILIPYTELFRIAGVDLTTTR